MILSDFMRQMEKGTQEQKMESISFDCGYMNLRNALIKTILSAFLTRKLSIKKELKGLICVILEQFVFPFRMILLHMCQDDISRKSSKY